jgi:hypothetical protein
VITDSKLMRVISVIIIVALIAPFDAVPVASAQSTPSGKYKKEELAQMLAPIALYPDSLLSQVLMASTYPLEIVQADRWAKQNPNLKGDSLDKALLDKDWDVSVKSLCYYPQVLAMLSEKLDWTTKLGDAFLAQQTDVMDSVQELRARAQAQNNLKTTNEQKVIVQDKYIVIEPARPDVVYVPAYNPVVVYGPWWYPAYPPYPWYYPGAVFAGAAISFGAGFFVGAAVAGWCGFGWGGHNVNVNINNTYNFNRYDRHGDHRLYQNGTWKHNPDHRRGVAYSDKATAQKFGQAPSRSVEGRRDARGYDDRGSGRLSRDTTRPGSDKRADIGKGDAQRIAKGGADQRAGQKSRPDRQVVQRDQSAGRDHAFSGMGEGTNARAASERGASSRASSFERGSARGGGGGFHGGGHGR